MASEKTLLEEAKEEIMQLREILAKLLKAPLSIASVLESLPKDRYILSTNQGGRMVLESKDKLKIHSSVLLTGSGGLVEVMDENPLGETAIVDRIADHHNMCLVMASGNQFGRSVYFNPKDKPEVGEEVVLDITGSMIIKRLGPPKPRSHNGLREYVQTDWNEIGGLDSVRSFFHSVFTVPHTNKKIFERYQAKAPAGVLLLGPPGCGKTLIAKAVATQLMADKGKGCFIGVKGPEVLAPYVGVAEQQVASLFKEARAFYRETGSPAVIFVDECESILLKRGTGKSSDVERTIVPAFLTEMDGMEERCAVVILATNRPDLLDPAITREGRCDHKFEIRRPSRDAASEIFNIHLRGVPLIDSLSEKDAAEIAADHLYSPKNTLYDIVRKNGSSEPFTLAHIASGAMIANVCNASRRKAMMRDIETKKASGVSEIDICAAIDDVLASNRQLDFTEDVAKHVETWRADVEQIYKVTSA